MNNKIIYIAGAGRSGSTLVDITLGSIENHWSLGELFFFVENGLMLGEYCSCGKKVQECDFWRRVTTSWNKVRKLTDEEFISIQADLLRNKGIFHNLRFNFFPKNEHSNYQNDLMALYNILFEVTKAQVLIDSSKNTQYIKQLSRK